MEKKGSSIFMELKEKGHGFIRKNKAGKVVSGIVLGATMFLAGQVASVVAAGVVLALVPALAHMFGLPGVGGM